MHRGVAESTELQRQFFEQLARRYDSRFLRARWPRNQEVKARHVDETLSDAMREGPAVEVGCGTGQIAELLLSWNPALRYVGVDLSESMLAIARSRLSRFPGRVELRLTADEELPLEPGGYAAAFGVDVLHHVGDPPALLRSLRSSLRPGSVVTFLEGNPRFPITTFMGLTQRAERGVFRIGFRNLRAWFEEAGLEQVRVAFFPLYTPPGPPRLAATLDRVDRAAARIPLLRSLALFIAAEGRAPGG